MAPHDRKGKGKERTSSISSSSTYPTEWSDWKWNEADRRYYLVREIARGKYEYAFERTRTSSTAVEPTASSSSVPRSDFGDGSSTRAAAKTYSDQVNYSTATGAYPDTVSSLTEAFAGTGLQDPSEIVVPRDAPHVATRDASRKEEKFDKNYKQHPKRDFQLGKVFKMLWSEPKGSGGATEYTFRHNTYGEEFVEKVRRFVIVKIMAGHCICIPIMSYGDRGTTKPGVHPEEHAVIYTTENPVYLKGEPKLAKAPIKVKPNSPQHKLGPSSRLNYAKVYTVEYNVKVWFIGAVERDCEWKLIAAYNEVHSPLPGGTAPLSSSSGYPNSTFNYSLDSGIGPLYQPQYSQYNAGTFPTAMTGYSAAAPGSFGYSPSVPASQSTQSVPLPRVATISYGPIATSQYQNTYQQPGEYSTGTQQDSYSRTPQYQDPQYQQRDRSWDDRR